MIIDTSEEIWNATPDELRVMMARARGWDVIKNVSVWRNPECGDLEISYTSSPGDLKQPAYLRRCICELRQGGDTDYGGHMAGCLEILPDWPNDITAAWKLLKDAHKDGVRCGIDNNDGGWNCYIGGQEAWGQPSPEIAICRAWLFNRVAREENVSWCLPA